MASRLRSRRSLVIPALLASALAGCVHLDYLAQAAAGQDEIAFRSRPIAEVLRDETVPPETRRLLSLIADVKAFGAQHGLTATNSYEEFADLEREAVVWVVTASHPLRFEAVTWTFPIVGEVPYLGWFERRDADRFAARLREQGHDVHVRPARAYSTLGWLDDPVLSTMLDGGPADLVDVVLHESVHATHYVPSQSHFNESLASFVADRLTPVYLRERLGASPLELHDYDEAIREHKRRVRRFHETYLELDRVYRSDLPDAVKLAHKARILGALREELSLRDPLNNAVLAQAQTYNSGGEAFGELLGACGGNIRRFMAAVRSIDEASFDEPQQVAFDGVIRSAARRGCGQP